ncbi:hypothetical protein SEA_PHISHY_1 [Gordonia phage Phishy]|nr:hypothetical protein SEA_PHISHY_1 [Gordonia phage Phishy]
MTTIPDGMWADDGRLRFDPVTGCFPMRIVLNDAADGGRSRVEHWDGTWSYIPTKEV